MRKIFFAVFTSLLLLSAAAFAQPPSPTQCVTTVAAGGTGDQIQFPAIPCWPTTTLVIMKAGAANATTTPAISVNGGPFQTITNFDGNPLSVGLFQPGQYRLLSYNGTNWLALSAGAIFNTQGFAVTPTNATLKAIGGATNGETIYRAGFNAAGDGGGATYTFASANCSISGGDNGLQVQPTTGTGCWLFGGNMLHSLQFGAKNDASADAGPALIAALKAVNASGLPLTIDPGTYLINTAINCQRVADGGQCPQTTNWVIYGNGATLLGGSSLETPALRIADASANVHTLDIYGLSWNMSQTPCIQGGPCALGQGVALYTEHEARATIHDPFANGSPDGFFGDAHSEDFWTPVTTFDAELDGGFIEGFWNGGVYASGDLLANSPAQKYNVLIHHATFWHVSEGIECKFSLWHCKSDHNHYFFNHVPIGSFWANTEPPAANLISTGDTIKFTTGRAYEIASGTRAVITNATVEDVGCDETGANCNASGVKAFLLDNGSTDITLSNSNFSFRDWTEISTLVGIEMQTSLAGTEGGAGSGGAITADNISLTNIDIGVFEVTTAGNSIQGSNFNNVKLNNVRIPYEGDPTAVPGTVFNYSTGWSGTASIASTLLCSTVNASGALAIGQTVSGVGVSTNPPTEITAEQVGACPGSTNGWTVVPSQTVSSESMTANAHMQTLGAHPVGFIGQLNTQSLATVGSLAAGATSSTQAFALPNVTAGDAILFTPTTAVLSSTPSISESCRGATNAVNCTFYNGTAGTVNFATMESGATPAMVRIQVYRGGIN